MKIAYAVRRESVNSFELVVVKEGVTGYHPYKNPIFFETEKEAQKTADYQNEKLGLSEDEVMSLVAESMFGKGGSK